MRHLRRKRFTTQSVLALRKPGILFAVKFRDVLGKALCELLGEHRISARNISRGFFNVNSK